MNAETAPALGISRNEPAEVYHQRSLEVANAGGLKLLASKSAAHFHYWATHPEDDKDSPAKRFGRMLHCSVLEPDVFDRTHIVLPKDAPQRPTEAMLKAANPSKSSLDRQDWWREFDERNAGRIVVSTDDYDRARWMGDSARAHPVGRGLLAGGEREVTFRWIDEATGLPCKARTDLWAENEFFMDVKRCEDASHEGFARAVVSYGYDLQQGHYVDGARVLELAIKRFIFLAIEPEPPFVCQPHILDARAEERGWTLRQRAIALQAECLRTGRWPGYSDGLIETSLPAWSYYGVEQ